MRTLTLLVLAACAPSVPSDPDTPDLEARCAALWPAATCLGGCTGAEEQLWAEGYLEHVAAAWGMSASPYLEVRHVEIDPAGPNRYVTLYAQLSSDWVVSVFEIRAQLPGPPSTVAEAEAAFDARTVPQVDVNEAPRPWSEVEAFVADCEAQLQVTFADPWCGSYVTLDPNDDDQAGVRFDFEQPLPGGYEYAYADVYAWGSEPDRCDTNSYVID